MISCVTATVPNLLKKYQRTSHNKQEKQKLQHLTFPFCKETFKRHGGANKLIPEKKTFLTLLLYQIAADKVNDIEEKKNLGQ